jgi:hypothetical protein
MVMLEISFDSEMARRRYDARGDGLPKRKLSG